MPLKFVILPAEPPVTVSSDQSQVPARMSACATVHGVSMYAPVQAPLPQLTATRSAPLSTLMLVLEPVKLMPCLRRRQRGVRANTKGGLTDILHPVPGVPRVLG